MDRSSQIRKISCLAVIRAGYTGNDYLVAHMRLVLCLIYRKQYGEFIVKQVIEDFEKEYHYHIPYFPMMKIINMAINDGFLKRLYNNKLEKTEKTAQFSLVEEEVNKSVQQFSKLSHSFMKYCQQEGVEYTEQKAEQILEEYINSQKLEHITGHIETSIQDKRIDYLFGKFIFMLKDDDRNSFDYLNGLVIGSILVDCLTFHETMKKNNQLDKTTFVFDASPVFIALGIDPANRTLYYLNMLQALKDKGANLAMFQHTYDEMQQVLKGTINWIDHPDFDPSKASITTEYFRNVGASRSDVEEFSIELKNKIDELNIEIINVEYDQDKYPYHIDYDELKEKMTESERKNDRLDETQRLRSIELDVKSITLLYFLRKEQRPLYIHDANYLFVTANQQIAKVAGDYHNLHFSQDDSLPTTLTDVFIGTYLWLSNPVQITQMNEQQIIAHAYLAVQPSTQLLEKLSANVDELLKKGEIDADTCYALRGSKLVAEKLAQKTLNDPDAYTESTPLEIIDEIRAEAAEEERKHSTKVLSEQRKEARKEQREIKKQLLSQIKESYEFIEKKIEIYNGYKNIANKNIKHWKRVFVIVLCILFAALIFAPLSYFLLKKQEWYSPVISIVFAAIPLAIVLLSWIYYLFTEKEITFKQWIKGFYEKRKIRKLDKLGYSENEYNKLIHQKEEKAKTIENLEKELVDYEEE